MKPLFEKMIKHYLWVVLIAGLMMRIGLSFAIPLVLHETKVPDGYDVMVKKTQ